MFEAAQAATVFVMLSWLPGNFPLPAENGNVSGQLTDPQGKPVANGRVRLRADEDPASRETITGPDGEFGFAPVRGGTWKLTASASGLVDISRTVNLADQQELRVNLQFGLVAPHSDAITVTADVKEATIEQPDPAQRVLVREEILDANQIGRAHV